MKEVISERKLIREMDAQELIEYYEELQKQDMPNPYLINEIMRQYYQLTGSYDY